MNLFESKKIQIISESVFDKYNETIKENSNIEKLKKNYASELKNLFNLNLSEEDKSSTEFEDRINECTKYYQNLLEENFNSM